jgi:hypothetical protein
MDTSPHDNEERRRDYEPCQHCRPFVPVFAARPDVRNWSNAVAVFVVRLCDGCCANVRGGV